METVDIRAGDLKDTLLPLKPIADQWSKIPILNTVKFEFEEGAAQVSATNLDLAMIRRCATVGQLGAPFCIELRSLLRVVQGYPRGDVLSLSVVKVGDLERLKIASGGDEWILPTFPNGPADWPDSFPDIVAATKATFALDAGFRSDVLIRVRHAVSREETRYYLAGINFSAEGDDLIATATDSHRLVSIRRPQPGAADKLAIVKKPITIPSDFVRAIVEGTSGALDLDFYEDRLIATVRAEGVVIHGKLIDGVYPDWRRVVPDREPCGYEFDRLSLISALTKLAATDRDLIVPVAIARRGGRVVMEARHPEGFSSVLAVAASTLATWPAQPVSFRRKLLIGLAKLARGGALRLTMTDATGAVRIEDSASGDFTAVLMPYRGDDSIEHEPPNPPASATQSAA